MKSPQEPLDPLLEKALIQLRTVPRRDPVAAAHGRERYLKQAESMREAVSTSGNLRHIRWFDSFMTIFTQKERSPMLTSLASIFIIVSILFGGTGLSVYAAQDSLPDQPLYGLKMLSEDIRADLAADPQERSLIILGFANRRVGELADLTSSGRLPPDAVLARLEAQLDQVLQLAAGLDDQQLGLLLNQVRLNLQEQEQTLRQLQGRVDPEAGAALIRARETVQARLQLVEVGLINPEYFRERLRQNEQLRFHQDSGTPGSQPSQMPGAGGRHGPPATPALGGSAPPPLHPSQTPGADTSPGPQLSQTPGGSGGSRAAATATKGIEQGPAPGSSQMPGDGDGSGPYATGTPTPGSGYGPGPGPEPTCTCTPEAGNGPQPTHDPGSGGGHGMPDPGHGGGKNP